MRALADRLEREAHAQLARAKQLRGAADTIEALRAMGPDLGRPAFPGPVHDTPPSKKTLQSPRENAYIAEMSQASSAENPRTPGAPLRSKGPVARVARILKITGADVARLLKVNYQTSRAWDDPSRRVPDDVAAKLDALVATPEAIEANRLKAVKLRGK